jgi:hypothetical protein
MHWFEVFNNSVSPHQQARFFIYFRFLRAVALKISFGGGVI